MFHVQEGQPKGPDYQVLSLITTSTADDRESLQEKTDLLSTLPQVQGRNAHYVLVIMIQCSLKASHPILISALVLPSARHQHPEGPCGFEFGPGAPKACLARLFKSEFRVCRVPSQLCPTETRNLVKSWAPELL